MNGEGHLIPAAPREEMWSFVQQFFPIARSLTGDGVRQSLQLIKERLPRLELHEVPSGTKCFDWIIPPEWSIRDAYVMNDAGHKVIDFQDSNLHVVGYSEPVNCEMTLEALEPHLHSLPELPTAIPYRTSYYQRTWGFCLSHEVRCGLGKGRYKVVIDSTLAPGSLTYGDLVLEGTSSDEVLVSTYVCHPSMANNESSGPTLVTFLARWLAGLPRRRLTYRIVFVPETIGAIAYLSRHYEHMRRTTIAGFQVTCVGDDRAYSFLPSRLGNTLADKVARHVLRHAAPEAKEYSFLQRGSDERQYCSPGIDLPLVSIMRSKHNTYPEYHTSLDNLALISPDGLAGAWKVYARCLSILEHNECYVATHLCEPRLDTRGLYHSLGGTALEPRLALLRNTLAYCDGNHDVIDIAEQLGSPAEHVMAALAELVEADLCRARDRQH